MDYNATCPVEPEVLEAMLPFYQDQFGNPASQGHSLGWNAEKAVERARAQVADLIGAQPNEVFFTAGATESNNWVIQGICEQIRQDDQTSAPRLVSSPIEHSSVLNSLKHAEKNLNAKVHLLKVDTAGSVSLDELREQLRTPAHLVSLMWANNEIGTLNPVDEIGELCRGHQAYYHCDATQAVGKFSIDLQKQAIDLLSFSAHKIYGPKGVGMLYIRSRNPKVQLHNLIYGGGQERGRRSGTLNVPAIVGMGEACAIAKRKMSQDVDKLTQLRDLLWTKIRESFPRARLNGHLQLRAPNVLNVTFRDCSVPAQFAGLAVSRGSACHSGSFTSSQVLSNIQVSPEEANQTLRFSLGRHSSTEDVLQACEILKKFIRG